MSSSKSYAYFALYGAESGPNSNFDPGELTKQLGINPAKVWRKGDNKGLTGILHTRSGWIWETPKGTELIWIDNLVSEVIDNFEEKLNGIIELKRIFQLESQLGIILYIDMNIENSTPALGHDLRTIGFLYKSQTCTDVDIYRYDSSEYE